MPENKENKQVIDICKEVLEMNDRGDYTQPAHGLYPHQWLWDSCFIAIGLRNLDVKRAQKEVLSLLRGQWHNGMMPNIIFRNDRQYQTDRNMWRSWLSPYAPDDVHTTGITQPPMLAEAVVKIGEKLSQTERRSWYKKVWPSLLAYHQWIYDERDPHNEGLVLQIHPWETGLDNTPPWTNAMHEHQLPLWIAMVQKLRFDRVINLFRRDTKSVPLDERYLTIEALILFDIQRRLRRKNYDINKILDHSLLTIEDLSFNCIFIRANTHLRDIAKDIAKDIPEDLKDHMKKSEEALEQLWDVFSAQYYSRGFVTHKLLKIPSIATLMPLYAGCISKKRAEELVAHIEDPRTFGTSFPIPSVPINSEWFHPKLYWQGPSWVNMNWLIIDGLHRYGFDEQAESIRAATIEMIEKSGCSEYFDPLTGESAGAANFSWTAALGIDLAKQ